MSFPPDGTDINSLPKCGFTADGWAVRQIFGILLSTLLALMVVLLLYDAWLSRHG